MGPPPESPCWDPLPPADPPGCLRTWEEGEQLPFGVHDVWCRRSAGEPWAMQLMLNESRGPMWVYRRHREVTMDLADLVLHDPGGIPFMAPQVQLLFKAKHHRRDDDADFGAVVGRLDEESLAWLAGMLARYHPHHPWTACLAR